MPRRRRAPRPSRAARAPAREPGQTEIPQYYPQQRPQAPAPAAPRRSTRIAAQAAPPQQIPLDRVFRELGVPNVRPEGAPVNWATIAQLKALATREADLLKTAKKAELIKSVYPRAAPPELPVFYSDGTEPGHALSFAAANDIVHEQRLTYAEIQSRFAFNPSAVTYQNRRFSPSTNDFTSVMPNTRIRMDFDMYYRNKEYRGRGDQRQLVQVNVANRGSHFAEADDESHDVAAPGRLAVLQRENLSITFTLGAEKYLDRIKARSKGRGEHVGPRGFPFYVGIDTPSWHLLVNKVVTAQGVEHFVDCSMEFAVGVAQSTMDLFGHVSAIAGIMVKNISQFEIPPALNQTTLPVGNAAPVLDSPWVDSEFNPNAEHLWQVLVDPMSEADLDAATERFVSNSCMLDRVYDTYFHLMAKYLREYPVGRTVDNGAETIYTWQSDKILAICRRHGGLTMAALDDIFGTAPGKRMVCPQDVVDKFCEPMGLKFLATRADLTEILRFPALDNVKLHHIFTRRSLNVIIEADHAFRVSPAKSRAFRGKAATVKKRLERAPQNGISVSDRYPNLKEDAREVAYKVARDKQHMVALIREFTAPDKKIKKLNVKCDRGIDLTELFGECQFTGKRVFRAKWQYGRVSAIMLRVNDCAVRIYTMRNDKERDIDMRSDEALAAMNEYARDLNAKCLGLQVRGYYSDSTRTALSQIPMPLCGAIDVRNYGLSSNPEHVQDAVGHFLEFDTARCYAHMACLAPAYPVPSPADRPVAYDGKYGPADLLFFEETLPTFGWVFDRWVRPRRPSLTPYAKLVFGRVVDNPVPGIVKKIYADPRLNGAQRKWIVNNFIGFAGKKFNKTERCWSSPSQEALIANITAHGFRADALDTDWEINEGSTSFGPFWYATHHQGNKVELVNGHLAFHRMVYSATYWCMDDLAHQLEDQGLRVRAMRTDAVYTDIPADLNREIALNGEERSIADWLKAELPKTFENFGKFTVARTDAQDDPDGLPPEPKEFKATGFKAQIHPFARIEPQPPFALERLDWTEDRVDTQVLPSRTYLKGVLPGCGKTAKAIRQFALLKKELPDRDPNRERGKYISILVVCPTNRLARDTRRRFYQYAEETGDFDFVPGKDSIVCVTSHHMTGMGIRDQTLHGAMSGDQFDAVLFDECYCNSDDMLVRFFDFQRRNPGLHYLVIADPDQNDPPQSHRTEPGHHERMVKILCDSEVELITCHRLLDPAERESMLQFKHFVQSLRKITADDDSTVHKLRWQTFFAVVNEIDATKRGITYFNTTRNVVTQKQLATRPARARSPAGARYRKGDELVYRETRRDFKTTDGGTFTAFKNYTFVIADAQFASRGRLTLKDVDSPTTFNVPLRTVESDFNHDTCMTTYQAQGMTLDEKDEQERPPDVVIYDILELFANPRITVHAARAALFTSATRNRRMGQVSLYLGPSIYIERQHDFRRKAAGYKAQDEKRGFDVNETANAVYLERLWNKSKSRCQSGRCYEYVEDPIFDRINDNIGHCEGNLRLVCSMACNPPRNATKDWDNGPTEDELIEEPDTESESGSDDSSEPEDFEDLEPDDSDDEDATVGRPRTKLPRLDLDD